MKKLFVCLVKNNCTKNFNDLKFIRLKDMTIISFPLKVDKVFFWYLLGKMVICIQRQSDKFWPLYVLWTYGVWSGPWYLGINVIRLKTSGLTSGIRNPNTDGLDRNLLLLISYLKSATVQDEVKSKGEVRQVGSW